MTLISMRKRTDKMATFDFADQIQETFLSCSICFQAFTHPKALPCLHTFCEVCLRDYLSSRYDGKGQFPCPLCRQNILIPHEGVAAFPDNHFIVGLGDTINLHTEHGQAFNEITPLLINSTSPLINNKSPLINSKSPQTSTEDYTRLTQRFGSYGREPHQFIQVSGITTSCLTDEIVVCDSILNRISVFSPSGQLKNVFSCDCSIRDVTMTRYGTILVTVSKAESQLLKEYSIDGRHLGGYGSFYRHENPFGIAMTSTNQPVVTGLRQNTIHVLTQLKKPSVRFGSRGQGATHFTMPYYVTTNIDDDIFVSDTGNHRVKVHKIDGTFVRMFGVQGSKPGQLFYPMGICVGKNGNIYVADANNFRVQAFTEDGHFLGFPVKSTYEYGIDVKPVNVHLVGDITLLVVLRGSSFCQIHSYCLDMNKFSASKKNKLWYQQLLCCV